MLASLNWNFDDDAVCSGPFVLAMGITWCPEHFVCANNSCRRKLLDIGFVEEKGAKYCEVCFEQYMAPRCSKCSRAITGVSFDNFRISYYNAVVLSGLLKRHPQAVASGMLRLRPLPSTFRQFCLLPRRRPSVL